VQQRIPSLLDPPVAFAHRGARAHAPENTLEAFALALRLGATGLESDVWVTSDGVAVLDHDGVVRLGRRKRMIGEVRRADLPEWIPTVAELFETCGGGYHLSLDLKDAAAGAEVIAVARAIVPELLPRLWLCSPVWRSLVPLRSLDDAVKLVDSTRRAKITEGVERRAAMLAEHGIDALNLHHTDWTGGTVALVHRFERYALGWDLQHERVLTDGFRMGLDGVFSDWVDRMMDAYRAEIAG
jgi:glycerophosphoryl diester phosphodiesterase